jgi:CheY-like chemotaxis protein
MSTPPIILLVDDDENDLIFFERAVRKVGFAWTIAAVRNGREAMEYLSGSGAYVDRETHPAPTHVILDLKLPEISGLEVLQWIRSQPSLRSLPVIIMSSSQQSSDMERAKALGVDAYEVKPVEFHALVSMICSIAERWRLSRAFIS